MLPRPALPRPAAACGCLLGHRRPQRSRHRPGDAAAAGQGPQGGEGGGGWAPAGCAQAKGSCSHASPGPPPPPHPPPSPPHQDPAPSSSIPPNPQQDVRQRLAKERLLAANKPDHYLVLGLPSTASADDITKAYKRLALKYHPDKCTNPAHKQAADVLFRLVSGAQDVLRCTAQRAAYDLERQRQRVAKFGYAGGWHAPR
jgi:hypothetical protein